MNIRTQAKLMFEYNNKCAYVKQHNIIVPDDLLAPFQMLTGKNTIARNCTLLNERIIQLNDMINIYRTIHNLKQKEL